MFNLAVVFVAAAALVAPLASAQDTSTIPACILTCSTDSLAAGGCTGITDIECICTSTEFQTAAGTCIATTCPDLAEQAVTIQQQQCATLGNGTETTGSASGSASSTAGTGASTTRSSATGSTTARPTTSGTTSRPASSTSTTSTGAGFHTASIASGVTLALFGAAFSLF